MDLTTNGVVITDAIKYVQGKMDHLNNQEKNYFNISNPNNNKKKKRKRIEHPMRNLCRLRLLQTEYSKYYSF
jgi:hypothetical protein